MENILDVIKIFNEIKSEKNFGRSVFPASIDEIKNIPGLLYPYFEKYLEEVVVKLDANRYFDILNPRTSNQKICVIEVGGTKTTIQIIQVVSGLSLEILPVDDAITIPTISNDDNILTKEDFISWLGDLIVKYSTNSTAVTVNLATAVNQEGIVLLNPPNIKVENIIGINIKKDLQKYSPDKNFFIFNDTEAVIAAQSMNPSVQNYSLFVDINGTGNNASVYTKYKKIQSLETGHVSFPIGKNNLMIELEEITGGKRGIEKSYFEVTGEQLTAYEIYNLAYFMNEANSNIAKIIYSRMYLYKAVSFLCISKFFKEKDLISDNRVKFILFGGINKLDTTKRYLQDYLDVFESDIELEYTMFGEDAGRYGAALLSSQI